MSAILSATFKKIKVETFGYNVNSINTAWDTSRQPLTELLDTDSTWDSLVNE